MKLALQHRKVVVDGALESKAATIQATAAMMHALAGLYSDPILAICREYMTNMLDGYTRLKRLKPGLPHRAPVVHCPNALEPWVEFTDFGCGMGYDEVWNVYTSFGASTKQETNDEVGGLGLGSKTAFTYPGADVWTVEARQDGQRHVIHCTKDDAGMPTFHRMDSEPTDLPDGVSVKLPVRPQDFNAFASKVSEVMTYYPMDVKIVGAAVNVVKPKYVHKGETWGVKAQGDARIIMGNVAYPVDKMQLSNIPAARLAFDGPVDVFVPIGSVDITPSREHLKYTDRTKTLLTKAADKVLEDIRQQATDAVAAAPTYWQANIAFHKYRNTDWLRNVSSHGVTWRGKPLSHEGVLLDITANHLKPLNIPSLTKVSPGRNTSISYDHDVTRGAWLLPDGNYSLWVDDCPKGGSGRLAHWVTPQWFEYNKLADGRYERLRRKQVDGARYYTLVNGALFVVKGDAQLAKRLSAAMGDMPVRLVSELPPAPKPAAKQGARKQTSTLLHYGKNDWIDGEVDTKAGGYYVSFNDGMHSLDGRQWTGFIPNQEVPKHVQLAKDAGLIAQATTVYGIPRRAKTVENRKNWLHFYDEVLVPALRDARKAKATEIAAWREWSSTLGEAVTTLLMGLPLSEVPEDVRVFATRAREVADLRAKIEPLSTLLYKFKLDAVEESDETPEDLLAALNCKYKLLESLRHSTGVAEDIVLYLQAKAAVEVA